MSEFQFKNFYTWPDGSALPSREQFADPDDMIAHAKKVAGYGVGFWRSVEDAERWKADVIESAEHWRRTELRWAK